MPEENDKTKKWRSKFAATKRVIADDAPPSADAKKALIYSAIACGLTAGALALSLHTGTWWHAVAVWPVSLTLAVMGGLRGKFEGDVISAGRSAARGRPFALAGVILGAVTVATAALYLVVSAVSYSAGPPEMPGKFGSPVKTFNEYVKSLRENDFDSYLACFAAENRADEDTNNDGTPDRLSELLRERLKQRFEDAKNGRVRQKLMPLEKPEYSAGGETAVDAGRAELQIRCFNEQGNFSTDARMKFKRESDGWKIIYTDI